VDVFHTFFGLGALSLLGRAGLRRIDAAFALPVDVVERLLGSRASAAEVTGACLVDVLAQ